MNIQILKFFFFLSFLFFSKPSNSQSSITFDAGQVFSTFNYTDTKGNRENDFSNNISGCFSLGYHYAQNNGLFFRSNIGMRKGGASIMDDGINVNWMLQYASANVGLGYMHDKWRLKPYFSVSPYYAYLLKGNQTIGPDNYDIKKNKSLKTTDLGLYFSPGFKMALSNYISFYTEFNYILGLQNLEESAQKSFNRGFSINLGVAIAIIKYNYVTTQ